MKLFSAVQQIFQLTEISISERKNTVEASFVTSVSKLPDFDSILRICSSIPEREIHFLF